MNLYTLITKAFNLSCHVTLNSELSYKIILTSLKGVKIKSFFSKVCLSKFSLDDLCLFMKEVLINSKIYSSNDFAQDYAKDTRVYLLLDDMERSTLFLYKDYSLNTISKITSLDLFEIKSKILMALNKIEMTRNG